MVMAAALFTAGVLVAVQFPRSALALHSSPPSATLGRPGVMTRAALPPLAHAPRLAAVPTVATAAVSAPWTPGTATLPRASSATVPFCAAAIACLAAVVALWQQYTAVDRHPAAMWTAMAAVGTDSEVAETAVGEDTTTPTKPSRPLRVLSGVQPTGTLTLGNYLGAIKQWVDLQNDPATQTESLFCVVDLHAITIEHDPKTLADATRMAAAVYLAAGLDPERVTIFVQSHVRAHAELSWLLTCACPMGWMERMIQFKEKSAKVGLDVGLGLFAYPVLMAADILLYQTDVVPVGEDQTQHIELTRDLARRFNDRYAKKMKKALGRSQVFREPKAQIVKESARIMSLLDGTSKMSKSAVNDNSRINLLDPPDVIRNKVKRCKTDSSEGLEWDNPERPECTNLLTIYKAVTGKTKEEVAAEVATMSWGTFKPLLAEAVVAHLTPLQDRYHAIMAQPEYLDRVLADGARRASSIAEKTLADAYRAMGFVPRAPL
eukprot:EG_transcript_7650